MRRLVRCLIALVLFSASLSLGGAEPISRNEARRIIDDRGADPLTGIWQIGGNGATIAILPRVASTTTFDIVLIDSPDMSILPGVIIGEAVTTGRMATYDAVMKSSPGFNNRKVKAIFTIDKDFRLNIRPYKQGKSIRLWRWLPYLFRMSVTEHDTRPDVVDGAIKIYPETMPVGPTLL